MPDPIRPNELIPGAGYEYTVALFSSDEVIRTSCSATFFANLRNAGWSDG